MLQTAWKQIKKFDIVMNQLHERTIGKVKTNIDCHNCVLSESFKMFTLGQINGLDSQLVSLLSGFINRTSMSLSLVGDLNILYAPVNSMGTFTFNLYIQWHTSVSWISLVKHNFKLSFKVQNTYIKSSTSVQSKQQKIHEYFFHLRYKKKHT